MIIAVDYDGTLEINKTMNMALISTLKGKQKKGDVIILWTCRQGQRLIEALNNLKKAGFVPNLVNENAPWTIKSFGYNPRKIFADIYIDDKNLR